MLHLQAPADFDWDEALPSVFLAGSIDEGKALNWQEQLVKQLADYRGVLLNPRRHDWGKSWKAEWADQHFRAQVNWELEGLERADWIFYYFAPNSQAPISLLELGLHAQSGRCLVCCPAGFWRQGNVRAVCQRYAIPFFEQLPEAIQHLKGLLV